MWIYLLFAAYVIWLIAFSAGEKRGRKKAEMGANWDSLEGELGRETEEARREWVRKASDALIAHTGEAVDTALLKAFGVTTLKELSTASREAAYIVVARRIVYDRAKASPENAAALVARYQYRTNALHGKYWQDRLP